MVSVSKVYFSSLAVLLMTILSNVTASQAQVEDPDRRYLFQDDNRRFIKAQEKRDEELLKPVVTGSFDSRFSAGQVEYLKESTTIHGTQGVSIAREGMQLRADELLYNTETQQVTIPEDLVLSFPSGELIASSGEFALESETGVFNDAYLSLSEGGGYRVAAKEIAKIGENEFELDYAEFTTCQCADGSVPWTIGCSEASIEREGYAQLKNFVFRAGDVPLFYSPYAIIPVKTRRSAGLLFPTFGYSNQHGFQYRQPIFAPVDETFDFTFTPFVETRTRAGSIFDAEKIFSTRHSLSGRLIYSNESQRGDNLRGTNITDIFDPTFDTDRFGGFYRQYWQTEQDVLLPSAVVVDAHLVSDDLFLRELADDDIGERGARVLTSRAVLRTSAGSWLYGDLSTEYNQSIREDQDFVLQRLPELDLTASESFRPFGFNPYGLKVKTDLGFQGVSFYREEGIDGNRYNLNPSMRVPYHYKNYLNGDMQVQGHLTSYQINTDLDPLSGAEAEDGEREVFLFRHRLSTALERVYDVPPDNPAVTLTSLGSQNQRFSLSRIKHTIEPEVNYLYIPFTGQDELPFFDSFDRIRNRNNMSMGLRSRILGRFSPRFAGGEQIPELTPRLEHMPSLLDNEGVSFFDHDSLFGQSQAGYQIQRGEIRELVNVSLLQNFDVNEYRDDKDPLRTPWSDLSFNLGVYPTPNFGFSFNSNIDYEDSEFSSYAMGTHLRDDRGDIVRARYTFIDNIISQVEGNLEFVLTDRLKLAGYGRYDELEGEIIEAATALRIESGCDCWHVDLGYAETINPDNQRVLLTFSLKGLGDITQRFSFDDQ